MSRQSAPAPDFGALLRAARKACGLTQLELGYKIAEVSGGKVNLAPSEISRYETGAVKNPSLETLVAMAAAVGQPLQHFTGALDLEDRLAALEVTVGLNFDLNEKNFLEIAERFGRIEHLLDELVAQGAQKSSRRGKR